MRQKKPPVPSLNSQAYYAAAGMGKRVGFFVTPELDRAISLRCMYSEIPRQEYFTRLVMADIEEQTINLESHRVKQGDE